jgi:endonuclease/exonuclease/phosphatase family metal-dependent hydrolase
LTEKPQFVRKLRLLTLNIAHGRGLSTYQGFHGARGIERNLHRIARLLEREKADIVALQEVDEDSHWNQRIHLLDFLQTKLGYAYGHLGVHNRRGGRLPLAYGNGVLSRFAIEHAEHQAFGRAQLGEKGFLYTQHALPQGHLPVVNLHLDYKSRRRRIEQVERLIEYLQVRRSQPGGETYFAPLVCGDFNSHSGKPNDAVRHLFAYLQQRWTYRLYPEGGRTFPSLWPTRCLDFILVPPGFKVLGCQVLRCYVSDHRPVCIDLEVLAPPFDA